MNVLTKWAKPAKDKKVASYSFNFEFGAFKKNSF